jgi:hypothetical protein
VGSKAGMVKNSVILQHDNSACSCIYKGIVFLSEITLKRSHIMMHQVMFVVLEGQMDGWMAMQFSIISLLFVLLA